MRTVHTTHSLIEAMAYRTGHPIEMTADAAYLTVGQTVWVAPLTPAGGAA